MIPARLNTVVIGARSLPTLVAFYQGLGWRSNGAGDLFAHFKLEGANLVLFSLEQLEAAANSKASKEPGFGGITPAIILPDRASLLDAVAQAESAGGRLLSPPADRPWGVCTAYFADPEDNVWELACLPAKAARVA